MSNLIPYTDIEKMGQTIAKSGLFGVKTPDQAIALMLIAQAEGKHPATAAQEYHVIQGRASLKADQMLARFQGAGGSVKWIKRTDTEASAEFSHPQGGSFTITWTMERAKKADLTGKDNWKKYPAQMLSARVISEGVRAVFPAACGSFYTPEEVSDFDTSANKPPAEKAIVVEERIDVVEAPKPVEEEKKPVPVKNAKPPIKITMSMLEDQMAAIAMLGTKEEMAGFIQKHDADIKALPSDQRTRLRNVYTDAIKNFELKLKGAVAA